MPSTMNGGSGYTAIQPDDDGRIYIIGAYYVNNATEINLIDQ